MSNISPVKVSNFLKVVIFLIFIAGVVHIVLSAIFEGCEDLIFSICLMANTILLALVLTIVKNKMAEKKEYYDVKTIFNFKHMILVGILYGAAFGATPFLIPFNTPVLALKLSASTYLFLHNFLTGMCVCPLVLFFYHICKNHNQFEVNLWDRSDSDLKTHIKLYETLVICITAICSLAFTAAYFSFLDLKIYAWVFSVVCAIFMLSAYFLPQYPIVKKINEKKRDRLEEINMLIQNEFDAQVDCIGNAGQADLKKLEKLKFLKNMVENTTSSFSTIDKKIKGIVTVSSISALPTVIKWISENLV